MAAIKKTKVWAAIIAIIFSAPVFNAPAAIGSATERIKPQDVEEKKKPNIVFLISEDPNNYEAHRTIPVFAEMLKQKYGYSVTTLLGSGAHGAYTYPGFEAVSKADLLVIFARRIALPHEQMNGIKKHLQNGKPLVGIRTANHAFTVNEQVSDGFEAWPAFVADILGCQNRGYGPTEPGTEAIVIAGNNDPITRDISVKQWHSKGNVYLVSPLLDTAANILLTGKSNDKTEPIAWTRTAGKSRIFYTSLGYPTDFESPQFISLLVNGINWALTK